MAASTIGGPRPTWTNDTGTAASPAADGTILNNARLQADVYDQVDELFAGAGAWATLTFGGLIAAEGFGTHTFSAGGTGANSLAVRNTTSGTGNSAQVLVGNNSSASLGALYALSSAYTTSGQYVAGTFLVEASGAAGLGISAANAAGVIDLWTAGVKRGTVTAAGLLTWHTAGINLFSASTSGGNVLNVRNTNTTGGAYGAVWVGNDTSASIGAVEAYAAATGTSDYVRANGVALLSAGAGGLAIGAVNAAGVISFHVGGNAEDHRMHASGGVSFGDTTDPGSTNIRVAGTATIIGGFTTTIYINDTANAQMTLGLTINQGANDNEALALKSSDVAHGVTTYAEADTYLQILKYHATAGGALIRGFTDTGSGPGVGVLGVSGDNITHDGTAEGSVVVTGATGTGTSYTDKVSDANVFIVRNNATNKMIVDGDGDVHLDGTSNNNVWDDHDDIQLIAGLRGAMTGGQRFARFIDRARPVLEESRVLSHGGFLSIKGAFGLTWDALRMEAMVSRALVEVLTPDQQERFATALVKQRELLSA